MELDCMHPFAQLTVNISYFAEKMGPVQLGANNDIYHFDNWWEAGPNQAICKFTGILHPPGE